MNVSRRKFIFGSALVGAAGSLVAASSAATLTDTTSDLRIKYNQIKIASLPPAFDGFKVGFLSDCHLGSCGGLDLLDKAITLLTSEKIDLLILGGDYILVLDLPLSRFFFNQARPVDRSFNAVANVCSEKTPTFRESLEQGRYYFEKVATLIAKINPSHGILGVLGNHDRWNSALNCQNIFNSQGIRILCNQSAQVSIAGQSLMLYGADDFTTGVPELPEMDLSSGILVSHNPDFLSEASTKLKFGLGLAGHTHGGQVRLPIVGPIYQNIEDSRLIQGVTSINGSPTLVSNGVGTSGLPWRINCPPEVNLITLTR